MEGVVHVMVTGYGPVAENNSVGTAIGSGAIVDDRSRPGNGTCWGPISG